MAAPSWTYNAEGDIRAAAALAASGTASYTVDWSAKFGGRLQIRNSNTGTAVAGTNGLKIEVFARMGTGPTNDTIDFQGPFTITTTQNVTNDQTIELPSGRYSVKLTNLDSTNQIDSVRITSATLDAVA
jgi:hypothetical protein